jgi:hypothetical protein
LLITPRLKRRIAQLADSNGTTLSNQAEYLIETAITTMTMLDAMNKTLEEITAGTLDTAMRKRGLVSRRIVTGSKSWVIWADPDFPIAASGFEAPTAEELEAQRARETEPATKYTDEQLDALWAEQHKEQPK